MDVKEIWFAGFDEYPIFVTGTVSILAALLLAKLLFIYRTSSKIPIVNDRKLFDFSGTKACNEFALHSRQIFEKGLRDFPDKPFRVYTETGLMTILPFSLANEVRNDHRLSFAKHTEKLMMAAYPGFEGFRDSGHDLAVSIDVINRKLTQALAKVTLPLSDECEDALKVIFTDNEEWHSVCLKDCILQLVARLSSRVFLGEELCRDPQWLKITIEYTVNAFMAADQLRMWSPLLRPIMNWFLPRCKLLRSQIKEAYNTIEPVIEKRKAHKAAASKSNGENGDATKFEDAIEWFEALSKGRVYDPVGCQLGLSLAAIHTTTDLITQTIFDLLKHPEYNEALRAEIHEVITAEGWTKTALYKMKLLDSVIKETQRLKPVSFVSMRREVTEDITLSDGTLLQKGTQVGVSSHRMWDPKLHSSPMEYDGYRFLNMRAEPGRENAGQLVTTSPDHLAFGHGKHACPGRFFAANEVKIALIHLLTRYDIQLAKDSEPKVMTFGLSLSVDPFAQVEVRRKKGKDLRAE